MSEIYQDIPTYENEEWTTTSFESREDFSEFIKELFKKPGEYLFNELSNKIFIQQSEKFKKDGVYCTAPFNGLTIREDGHVRTCCSGINSLGNLNKDTGLARL
jgi:MoaA/NifB/PqqE/SkfB family radical SAM enzyme